MTMTSFRIVEHLDIVEYIGPGLLLGCIDATADPFTLE